MGHFLGITEKTNRSKPSPLHRPLILPGNSSRQHHVTSSSTHEDAVGNEEEEVGKGEEEEETTSLALSLENGGGGGRAYILDLESRLKSVISSWASSDNNKNVSA